MEFNQVGILALSPAESSDIGVDIVRAGYLNQPILPSTSYIWYQEYSTVPGDM